MASFSKTFDFNLRRDHQKNFLWASRLWVGRRKEPILGYVPKKDEKKNSGGKGLGLYPTIAMDLMVNFIVRVALFFDDNFINSCDCIFKNKHRCIGRHHKVNASQRHKRKFFEKIFVNMGCWQKNIRRNVKKWILIL